MHRSEMEWYAGRGLDEIIDRSLRAQWKDGDMVEDDEMPADESDRLGTWFHRGHAEVRETSRFVLS
jgi:hypothetical protein